MKHLLILNAYLYDGVLIVSQVLRFCTFQYAQSYLHCFPLLFFISSFILCYIYFPLFEESLKLNLNLHSLNSYAATGM